MEDEPKIAVALEYKHGISEAPKIVATGKDELAQRIIALAKEHGIEVRRDQELAEILSVLEVDSLIPLETYSAVAEILSFIYRKNRQKLDNHD
jgi:flagellar biosynthesis protein